MLYANDVISEHNKLQIFIANEEKSSQELLPADHAWGKTFPEETGLYNACRIETKAWWLSPWPPWYQRKSLDNTSMCSYLQMCV